MPHEFVRPFHFWCQKVLPLVFDDSLSYYEVLAKMRDYLNTAIAEINAIGGEFEGVKNQLTQLQTHVDEYFAELDVNQAISDKLDDMVESGEMDAVITPIFAAYANPLFAASVADMIATNFAYASYENNKIYTFNQSTGLYQTTGKEFGGVVSSVDEMEDRDKYYALDSDGMLYSYDFPEGAFVATGLTYGGYRYGVNAMRPIANTYVLTTDSHVYAWNGSEYADTGVIYGLSNTAFIWRRKLTNADNVTTLIVDGWYSFDENGLPDGLPVDMSVSNGFVVVYSLPNDVEDSDNVATSDNNTVDTQRSEGIRANSRNKRIVLKTHNGGSWFWNGENWFSENEIGFQTCTDCNAINWNSVVLCDENTVNSPIPANGVLKTYIISDEKAQTFFANNYGYFRCNDSEWREIADKNQVEHLQLQINDFFAIVFEVQSLAQEQAEFAVRESNKAITAVDELRNAIMENQELELNCDNNDWLFTENGDRVCVVSGVIKTDKTLTIENVPADAKAVGDTVSEGFEQINTEISNTNANVNSTLELVADTAKWLDDFSRGYLQITNLPLCGENSRELLCENGETLDADVYTVKTDSTLSQSNIPAEAKATGEAFDDVNERIIATSEMTNATATRVDIISTPVAYPISAENLEIITSGEFVICAESFTSVNNNLSETVQALSETQMRLKQEQEMLVSTCEAITTTANGEITTENKRTIADESGNLISGGITVIATDSTLTQDNVPADANAVGYRLEQLEPSPIVDYATTSAVLNKGGIIVVNLIGNLPLTKSNVDAVCEVTDAVNNEYFTGKCKLKVQGSSSVVNPEKNYTLTLETNLRVREYETNKWNLKCNYIDPSQIRNLLGAKLWVDCLKKLLPEETSKNVVTNTLDTITTESTAIIQTEPYGDMPIQKAPFYGASDGYMCLVLHNGKFHGVYTMQIPKGAYMFNMSGNGEAIIGVNDWEFTHLNELDDDVVEVEYASSDMTDEIILEKLNRFADFLATATPQELVANYDDYSSINLWALYFCQFLYTGHYDGSIRNILLYTYDGGNHWLPSVWDMDGCFGNAPYAAHMWDVGYDGTWRIRHNNAVKRIMVDYPEIIKQMWDDMRDVYSTANLYNHIKNLYMCLQDFLLQEDFKKWAKKGKTNIADKWSILWYETLNKPFCDSIVESM